MQQPGRAAEIKAIGIGKSFGSFRALDNLSLNIGRGEFLTLLGPSGSGKTTTLMMIAGFETPSSGEHRHRRHVGGRRSAALPAQHRHGVPELCAVPASHGRGQHRLPAEACAGCRRPSDRSCVGEAHRAGANCRATSGRCPRQLSGGQQQRVALARAIVFKPRLLAARRAVWARSTSSCARTDAARDAAACMRDLGITFIFVTHDQEEALAMSDRVAVMNHGKIAAGRRAGLKSTTGRTTASSPSSSARSTCCH